VALAAGHRPCGLCRRGDYLSYRRAVTMASVSPARVLAPEINSRLASQRHRRGKGLERAGDRILWPSSLDELPTGTIVSDPKTQQTLLVTDRHLQPFGFDAWGAPRPRSTGVTVEVLTPPTSVSALANGFVPRLHPTAQGPASHASTA
jgi:hypothetical protein